MSERILDAILGYACGCLVIGAVGGLIGPDYPDRFEWWAWMAVSGLVAACVGVAIAVGKATKGERP